MQFSVKRSKTLGLYEPLDRRRCFGNLCLALFAALSSSVQHAVLEVVIHETERHIL